MSTRRSCLGMGLELSWSAQSRAAAIRAEVSWAYVSMPTDQVMTTFVFLLEGLEPRRRKRR